MRYDFNLDLEMNDVARRPKEDTKPLGDRLRRLRLAKGYTETELGKAIGSSHRMIAYYEIQGGNPPADILVKLAKALDVSTDELLGLDKPKKSKKAEAPESLRLWRKLKQVTELPPKERRNLMQFIDAMIEREELKKARG